MNNAVTLFGVTGPAMTRLPRDSTSQSVASGSVASSFNENHTHLHLETIDAATCAETERVLRDREAELKLEIDVAARGGHEIIDIASKSLELWQSLCEKWLTADYTAKR